MVITYAFIGSSCDPFHFQPCLTYIYDYQNCIHASQLQDEAFNIAALVIDYGVLNTKFVVTK